MTTLLPLILGTNLCYLHTSLKHIIFCAAYYILLVQAAVTACITQHIVNTQMVFFYSNGNIMMAIIFGAFVKKFTTMLPLASTGISRLSPST